jgi:hypothetical protein
MTSTKNGRQPQNKIKWKMTSTNIKIGIRPQKNQMEDEPINQNQPKI